MFALALGAIAGPARADRIVLVGGTVIEGRVTAKNGKVVIETESGEIAVPAESVSRVEKGDASVSRFEARYAALRPGDVHARLELADYCRAHDMRAREHKVLLEVIEIDRDNETARARLGYVKTEHGWLTREEAMQTRGLVREDGKWVSREDRAEMERLRLEREALAQHREEAEVDEHQRRIDQSIRQAEIDEQKSHLRPSWYDVYWGYGYPVALAPGVLFPRIVPTFGFRPVARPSAPSPFNDTSLSVVKVPYRRP